MVTKGVRQHLHSLIVLTVQRLQRSWYGLRRIQYVLRMLAQPHAQVLNGRVAQKRCNALLSNSSSQTAAGRKRKPQPAPCARAVITDFMLLRYA
jgi:hypothetical protein